jgi:Flp pilus assembly protein TadG
LDEAAAMLLAPCTSVHTVGMRFPIDVVFVDRQGYALKVVRNLRPWRIALSIGGSAVIEMAAGSLRWGQVVPGDRLYLAPAGAATPSAGTAGSASTAERPEPAAVKRRAPLEIARRLRETAGNSLLEAAIITPLLLLLTLSIIDFGALFYVYLALENGVSQATRYGVTGNVMPDPSNPANNLSHDDSIKAAMRSATPTLTLPDAAFSFQFMPAGGGAWQAGSGGPNQLSKLRVNYTWRLINPMLWPFFPGGQITFNVESSMKNEGAPAS